jgi:hypothetical protein
MTGRERTVATALLAAGSLIGACGGDAGDTDSSVIRRDSAGIAIVETPAPLWSDDAQWTVDPEPVLSIGLTEGDENYLFGEIAGIVRLDDGTIVVADGQARLIRYYDAQGGFIRQVGGQGGGPTEFGSLQALWHCGPDLVYGHDLYARRVKAWDGGGVFQRDFPLLEPGQEARGPYRTACSSSGDFLVAGWGDFSGLSDRRSRFYAQSAPIWLLDVDGQPLLELGEYVISERALLFNEQTGGGGSGPHPFGRSASFAITDSAIYLGTAERLDVQVYDRSGRLVRSMRGPAVDLSIDQALVDRYAADAPDADARYFARIVEAGLELPDGYAAYSAFRVDSDGNLWVQRFGFPWEASSRWGVFSEDGAFLGHVEMPASLTVHQIGADWVIGVATDDLDVERVGLYRLDRGPAGGSAGS